MEVQPRRVYIDTMIFIKQLFNVTHPLHSKVQNFFNDVANQRYKGITSSFTRSEYLAVIKGLLAENMGTSPVQNDINKAVKVLDDFIDEMGIEYFDSDGLASTDKTIFSECHKRIDAAIPIRGNNTKWRTLGGADSVILLFAERCNSDIIATNDDGFKGSNSHVKPLIVKEAY